MTQVGPARLAPASNLLPPSAKRLARLSLKLADIAEEAEALPTDPHSLLGLIVDMGGPEMKQHRPHLDPGPRGVASADEDEDDDSLSED